MLKTLTWKEARELLPLVALALVAQGLLLVAASGLSIVPVVTSNRVIPFVDHSLGNMLLYVGGIAGLAIGLWQTLWESGRGTFQFLLHRPVERASVFTVKLAVGIAMTLLISGLPILAYALWAALPGTHASPFFWSMTTWAWLTWFRLPVVYLGAFLSGLRPGRWFGSRALPLGAAVLAYLALIATVQWPWASLLTTLAVEACFVLVIYRVAATRDYS